MQNAVLKGIQMKRINSIFDVLGPVMIGPSSSHTAGAARLGKIARYAAEKDIKSVKIYLHGSFAQTAKGHGTEKALVAGILGMEPYDERLRHSLETARESGVDIKFETIEIRGAHPNTARFLITRSDGSLVTVTGASLGGGAVMVTEINGFDVEITGEYYTLITKHVDIRGIISKVTTLLAKNNVNIGNMKVRRNDYMKEASMIIETDENVDISVVKEIKNLEEMISLIVIKPVKEAENVQ